MSDQGRGDYVRAHLSRPVCGHDLCVVGVTYAFGPCSSCATAGIPEFVHPGLRSEQWQLDRVHGEREAGKFHDLRCVMFFFYYIFELE